MLVFMLFIQKKSLILSIHVFSFGLWFLLSPVSDSSSCLISLSCSDVRLIGVSTCTLQYKSPFELDLIDFTPLSLILNILPDWVPFGIFNSTFPSNVGITTFSPNIAVERFIGTSQRRLFPSLVNIS